MKGIINKEGFLLINREDIDDKFINVFCIYNHSHSCGRQCPLFGVIKGPGMFLDDDSCSAIEGHKLEICNHKIFVFSELKFKEER